MEDRYIKLHKYIRFRKEKKFVLLTDCASMENYLFPKWTLKYLNKLKLGVKEDTRKNKRFNTLLHDLNCISALTNGGANDVCVDNLFEKFERF